MFKKLNKKGFTLAELLVVVAIIGVLVAISIPIFTSQLEKARDAVTVANIRTAYAEAQTLALTASKDGDKADNATWNAATHTVTVENVVCEGHEANEFSGLASELPALVKDLADDTTAKTTKKIAFTYDATTGALKTVAWA